MLPLPIRALAVLSTLLGLMLAGASPGRANLITNGSFELPDVGPTGVEVIFSGGEPAGFGWQVGHGNVEVAGELYAPLPGPSLDGDQHLDLNGVTVGNIFQFFSTTVGVEYEMSFAYASNYAHHGPTHPALATVYITDVSSTQVVTPFSISHGTSASTDLDWFVHSMRFTAIGASTAVGFDSESRQTPLGGILLDAVSVTVVPEPGTASLCLFGLLGLAARRRIQARVASSREKG